MLASDTLPRGARPPCSSDILALFFKDGGQVHFRRSSGMSDHTDQPGQLVIGPASVGWIVSTLGYRQGGREERQGRYGRDRRPPRGRTNQHRSGGLLEDARALRNGRSTLSCCRWPPAFSRHEGCVICSARE